MNIKELYRLALNAFETSDFVRAEAILQGFVFHKMHTAGLNLLAVIQTLSEKHDQALKTLHLSIVSDPLNSDTYNNLGSIYLKMNQLLLSKANYERAISLNKNNADAKNNLGTVLFEMGQFDEAMKLYRSAIALNPRATSAYINLGNAQKEIGQHHEALHSYQEAISIDPNNVDARFNRSLTLLKLGHFHEGWAEHELRWKRRGNSLGRTTLLPQWTGKQDLQGRTILIWGEQGLGDQIMMARYVPLLVERGATVLLEVDAPLITLFRTIKGVKQVGKYGEFGEVAHVQCPMMSLPLAFGTTSETIPANTPYLSVAADRVAYWAEKLGPKIKPRIGVMWSGGQQAKLRNRSIPLDVFRNLFSDDFEWISLQKEVLPSDRPTLSALATLRHFGDEQDDFMDAAAICELVDVVVTVDTSIAHLAGALARPTRVLLPFPADWRWMTQQEMSPWYPSMRLTRQWRAGPWATLIDEVRSNLTV